MLSNKETQAQEKQKLVKCVTKTVEKAIKTPAKNKTDYDTIR